MKNAKLSVQVWGVYLVIIGAGLFAIPAIILTTLGIAAPLEPWIRVLGAVALALGYYHFRLTNADIAAFYPWTVQARWGVALLWAALVVLNLAPVQLLLFSALDFLGGLWTFLALRGGEVRLATTP